MSAEQSQTLMAVPKWTRPHSQPQAPTICHYFGSWSNVTMRSQWSWSACIRGCLISVVLLWVYLWAIFSVMHILVFQAGSKNNWTLTHHHEVKFSSEYLKLTKNMFDMKKQKATVQPPSFSVSLTIIVPLTFPLIEGVWQASEKTGLDSNSCRIT